MHPITGRPERAWVVYTTCGAIGVLMAILPLTRAGAEPAEAAWFAVWGLLMFRLALESWHIARYVPIGKVSFINYAFTAIAAAAMSSLIWLGIGWSAAYLSRRPLPSVLPALQDAWVSLWVVGATAFVSMLLLISALDAADEGEAAARRALESEVSSRDAELRALRAQVDPHFLFNCLHSISSMTARDAEGARRMCLELADFFRASLRAGAEQRIPLAAELQLLRNYFNIEQVRFGARLNAHVDEAGESADVMVPPLLLQPLAENAVRHGIATLVDGGSVRVSVRPAADRVEIVVENPYDPEGRRPGSGVGLANVRDRLETGYRGAAKMRVDTTGEPSPSFKVSLSIPAEGQPAAERSGATGSPRATRPGGVQGPPPEIK